MKLVVLFVIVGFAAGFEVCNKKITDKDTGETFTPEQLLQLAKNLRAQLTQCGAQNNGGNALNVCDLHPPNKSWLTDGCTKKNNSFCGTENGGMSCVCGNGFHWNQQKSVCISDSPQNQAPKPKGSCTDTDGKVYAPNVSYLLEGCQTLKLCFNGKMYTQGYECAANSFCGKECGKPACVCNKGFRWDENKKNCIV
ncbi:hypothetical protein QR680_000655 [Steinernema hermaphroditum]|uniref:TIL domain-containing protein n=1 Tax=Steinernema hermaphroditum TaxID=289476 RepID=A0AA39GXB9_9BILA|nr:hypothetical protein QR680_000655 [Steinernema hermaphroditum]